MIFTFACGVLFGGLIVKFVTLAAVALGLAISSLAAPSQATTITFEGATIGPGFTGPVVESGFTYSLQSGDLYINATGNPGNNVEPTLAAGTGGVLKIVSSILRSLFQFNSLDLSSVGSVSITVEGLLGGSTVATDLFPAPDAGIASYATMLAINLLGKNIDE